MNLSPSPDTDKKNSADLVFRAQQGDSEAFEALFNAHRSMVLAVCLRMTAQVTDAEDLSQDVFLRAFVSLSKFRAESSFSTWLYRITVNTVLMHFRKPRVSEVSIERPIVSDFARVKKEYGGVDCSLSTSVERVALGRALAQLPPGCRRILLLHEFDGYGHREIAERLQCSIGNSKSQLHRARSKMREILTVAA